ncbi:hypothetical protein PC39_05050 [Salinisphaera sp. PC39]|uniref:DUF2066 domain-containing protein n=1 Tax=Salinisphaera sp. PC39 TaxID=1304156 RepID=UPI003341E53C
MNLRRFLSVLLLALFPAALPAADVDDLYVGEAVVADQSAEARETGLREALGRVLVRVTGDPGILRRDEAEAMLARASAWVQRYGYETAETAATSDDVPETTLRARFDGNAVARALREAGLPVWGRERPRTLVLLLVEGEADIVPARADDLLADMRAAAERRGIPLVFPERGGSERRQLRAADLRYGDLSAVNDVAQRYGASHILVGRLERVGGAWRGEWTLNRRGETVSEWSDSAGGRDALLAAAAGRLADSYARRFAVYGGAAADTVVTVAVDGVDAVAAYARIDRYLRGLTAVQTVNPVLVDREAVVFRVQISGEPDVLARSIELAGWLTQDELARNLAGLYAAGGNALGYRLGS